MTISLICTHFFTFEPWRTISSSLASNTRLTLKTHLQKASLKPPTPKFHALRKFFTYQWSWESWRSWKTLEKQEFVFRVCLWWSHYCFLCYQDMNFPSHPGDSVCIDEIKKREGGSNFYIVNVLASQLPCPKLHLWFYLVPFGTRGSCWASVAFHTLQKHNRSHLFLTYKKFFLAYNKTLTGEPGCPGYPELPEVPYRMEKNVSQW